jgi:hypothetical protein
MKLAPPVMDVELRLRFFLFEDWTGIDEPAGLNLKHRRIRLFCLRRA